MNKHKKICKENYNYDILIERCEKKSHGGIGMLKEVRIKNYRSFQDEIVFLMEADKNVSEHQEHLYCDVYGNEILKVASIYGPNAGGKTNLLKAINFLNELREFTYQLKVPNNSYSKRRKNYLSFSPFLFKDGNRTIEYSIYFLVDRYELGYQIALDVNNREFLCSIKHENFVYRELNKKEYIELFNRENDKIISNELSNELQVDSFFIADNLPFIFYLYDNYVNKVRKNKKYLNLISRFMFEINNIKYTKGITEYESLYNIEELFYDEDLKNKVIKIINALDIDIEDIRFNAKSNQDVIEEIYCIHNINGEKKELLLQYESEGTKGLIGILPKLIKSIEQGTILLVDELDSHLHPKILAKIVELFNSSNNLKAQLIFNSHDIWNMNSSNFRRDEIWFVYRDENLISDVVCLSDYINFEGKKVRKDAKYSKQYMEGKYGADPFIKSGVDWYEK